MLSEPLELLGTPVLDLEFSVDKPLAMVAVRLSDVAPGGNATRVSYGLANLAQQSDPPAPLKAGKRHHARVVLNAMAQSFPAGHRLRLSTSTSYWPLARPPWGPAMLTAFTGVSQFSQPIRIVDPNDDEPVSFAEPEAAAPIPAQQRHPGEHRGTVTRDLAHDESTLDVVKDLGVVHLDDIDLSMSRRSHETYKFTADDFSSVRGDTHWVIGFERGGWSTRTVTRTVLTCTPEGFHVHAQLDAYEGEQRIAAKTWTRVIPRDLI